MASFTINFDANTVGDHYVGYRTYNNDAVGAPNPLSYDIVTVPVTVPGIHSLEIVVPGNTYCGPIEYTGYVIAACEDQTDSSGDGKPDGAVDWNVTIAQQDADCVKHSITCANVPIESITIDAGGAGYVNGDVLAFTGAFLVEAEGTVSVSGGVITGINITNPGSYEVAPTVTVTSGGGGGAALSVVMSDCPSLDLRDIDCSTGDNSGGGNPIYDLELNEEINVCGSSALIAALDAQFESVQDLPCHCKTCLSYSVENTDSVARKVTIQSCWDLSHPSGTEIVTITYTINAGETLNLGCAVEDTIVTENALMVVTPSAC